MAIIDSSNESPDSPPDPPDVGLASPSEQHLDEIPHDEPIGHEQSDREHNAPVLIAPLPNHRLSLSAKGHTNLIEDLILSIVRSGTESVSY